MGAQTTAFEELADWVDGRLSAARSSDLESRLHDLDPALLDDLTWLEAFSKVRAEVAVGSAPERSRGILAERFRQYAALRATRPWSRLALGRLRFDSAAVPSVAGIRSFGFIDCPRHLVYTTDVADVAVDVHRHSYDNRLDVMGQLFPSAGFLPGAFKVRLSRGADSVGVSNTDELGEFLFPDIQPGDYHMILSTGNVGILVTPVSLIV
jgi:hypothetical protein